MFKKITPLRKDAHADLRLKRLPHYRHAAAEMVCPVLFGEAWQISREYVMVFPKEDDTLPLALLGTEPGVNTYVGTNPPWWGRYVPAHIRRYPFLLAPQPDSEKDGYTLMIDEEAEHLSSSEGDPLFTAEGNHTQMLEAVTGMLSGMQAEFFRTTEMVRRLSDSGLLKPEQLTVKRAGTEPVVLSSFRVVDLDRFRECDTDILRDLLSTRTLDLIYAHICSLTNLSDGLLAKKGTEPAAEEPETAKVFREDEFDFKFVQ